jgi:predicted ArsR family transcriptional regulator
VSEADLDAIGLLTDPARRALYAFVARQGREVSRNEAAEAVGVQRTLAAFHLDRLAQAGLLEVDFRRLNQRSGPGAGRPAKVYRRPQRERAISVPPRDYVLAARVFAEAVERSGIEPKLYAAARDEGVAAGAALRAAAPAPHGIETELERELTQRGYEPHTDADGRIRLRNCPFHTVAEEYPVVACGMNLALLEGLVEGAGLAESHAASLDPRAGTCCVVIDSKTSQH